MKLKHINYIPVLNGGILNAGTRDKNDGFINDKRITFYTEDSIFKYPYFLINPYHHDKVYEKIKERGDILKDKILLADSGGLQAITLGNKKFTPIEVFKWQQENSNIGFSVDELPFIPPKDVEIKPSGFSGWSFDKKNFLTYAEKSADNIQMTKPYRNKKKYPDFAFYGIIQGTGYEDFLEWYNVIRDDDYLDGYCVKASNVSPISLAQTSMFVMEHITKPVHYLGVGNISRSIIIYYASKYIKQPITFDSSSYDLGTQYRTYLLPTMINKSIRLVKPENKNNDDLCSPERVVDVDDLSKLCDCVVCRTIGDKVKEMVETNDFRLGTLLSVHNMILNIRMLNYIELIINNKEKLHEFVLFNFESALANKILLSFEMIDLCAEKGYAYVKERYKDEFVSNKNNKQSNIFEF
jgi:tRNA-guanine family transglycosylase